jgi:hypothetical protein
MVAAERDTPGTMALPHADDGGLAVGHGLFAGLRATGRPTVDEQEHDAAHEEHDAHHQHVLQQQVHLVLEEQAEDHRRQKAHKKLGVEVDALEEAFPVERDHRQDGPELDGHGEQLHELVLLDPHDGGPDDHVAGARDRQVLGDALDDREDDGLQKGHCAPLPLSRFRMAKAMNR